MHILICLIYLVSGKTHFDNNYYRVNADFNRVNKPVRQIFFQYVNCSYCKKEKMEALEKKWGPKQDRVVSEFV